MKDKLTHLDEAGNAHMVDISAKLVTEREATAQGIVTMQPDTLAHIRAHQVKKGDVLKIAQLAGIMGAKRTPDLIPLCHPMMLNAVEVILTLQDAPPSVHIQATCRVSGKTGVEMEALTAVSTAALTVYDMVKSVDKSMAIEGIRLIEKKGGKSGHYQHKG